MRVRAIAKAASVGVILTLALSCQSGSWKQGGDKLAKGGIVGTSAGVGALLGGPIGSLVGGVLGYFGVSLVEVETAFDDFKEQSKVDVDAARSSGVQQGADVSQQFLAVLQGNPEAAAFLREKATEAAVGVAKDQSIGILATVFFWIKVLAFAFLALIAILFAAYIWKQKVWDKRNDKRAEDKVRQIMSEQGKSADP